MRRLIPFCLTALLMPAIARAGAPQCADEMKLDIIMSRVGKKCPAVKDVEFSKRKHTLDPKGGSWSCPVKGGGRNECLACDGDVVFLKDIKKDTDHFLVLPRDYASGIEEPALAKAHRGLKYLNAAWRRRDLTAANGKAEAERVALVINPCSKRGQDWLHIHLARLNNDPPNWTARCERAREARSTGDGWIDADFHGYSMRYLEESKDELAEDPFELLAPKGGAAAPGHQGMAVVHCALGGFLLLSDTDTFPEGDFIDGVHFKGRNPPCSCEPRSAPLFGGSRD